MTQPIKITPPLTDEVIMKLKSGDRVLLTGVIYTGRDMAHKYMVEGHKKGQAFPFDLAGQVLYYTGPTPAPPGRPIGAAGPTTSYRMDKYAPYLLEHGLKAMIGKGPRGRGSEGRPSKRTRPSISPPSAGPARSSPRPSKRPRSSPTRNSAPRR